MNSLSCQCRRQTERGDKHRGRNPHAVFTAVYIFLFAESSPSYGRRPVLGPSLFSMSSGRRKLASRIPSILSAHGCILNCTLRQLIIQVQYSSFILMIQSIGGDVLTSGNGTHSYGPQWRKCSKKKTPTMDRSGSNPKPEQ